MLAAVDALLPLSLLEAVRQADTPNQEELDAELVDELRNKRLGLSDTVYAQIKRYTDANRRRQRIAPEETLALARRLAPEHRPPD
jgi:NCAIR mutase (PurE)-related protein